MIVYKATNIENGKVYIGATTLSLKSRIRYHIKDAYREDRPKGYFQEAIVKHGIDSFSFEEIDHADTRDEMYSKEEEWIKYYNSTDSRYGYNLDSGGIFCKKQESTKRKIGDTTIRKWKDPEISSRMRDGLRKGIEIWKEQCRNNRVLFVCPECGKQLYLMPYEARHKTYCSMECAKAAGVYKRSANIATKEAGLRNHQRNLDLKREIANDIIDWALENKSYVMSCKLNDVTNHYKPLTDFLYEKYGIFDLRSFYICFDVSNKKEFAIKLKNIVSEENIC